MGEPNRGSDIRESPEWTDHDPCEERRRKEREGRDKGQQRAKGGVRERLIPWEGQLGEGSSVPGLEEFREGVGYTNQEGPGADRD